MAGLASRPHSGKASPWFPRRRLGRELIILGIGGAASAAFALAGGPKGVRRYVRQLRDDHARRPALWNRFYSLNWGETTTNNYGFAPAEGEHPQRFQHQMYRELLRLLKAKRPLEPGLKLLEVSCGRGGGLNAFLAAAPGMFDATGLDVAGNAIAFCRANYGEDDRRRFVEGSALNLPFPDASFDVVLNVEASNDYGDRPRFFAEVARVLKPDGVFVYTDSFRERPGRANEVRSWRPPVSPPISPTSPVTSPKPAGSTVRAAAR